MGSAGPTHLGDFDVLVVGGGFCGVWALNALRKHNFKVQLLEAGTALGGIWHWNAYPGARVDTPVPTYQLTADETWQTWDWKQRFPDRDELSSYFKHLDKVWDLSRDVSYSSRVTSMRWDEDSSRWRCIVNNGESECNAWSVLLCVGFASKRYIPPFRNLDVYKGEMHHTAVWPQGGVNLKDRRVAVIGTGASGVQVIQEVAKEASDMTVFQRTPSTALHMENPAPDNDAYRSEYQNTKEKMKKTFAGFDYEFVKVDKHPREIPKEERFQLYESLYHTGGLHFWLGAYMDMLFDKELNEEAYQFWRSKTLPRIKDPKKAKILAPEKKIHPFGTKRISLEQDFFEVFNQDNVDLIDLRTNGIGEFTTTGIKTADGKLHEFDLIILATGFDSITGGIVQMDIQNPEGKTIGEKWKDGTYTSFGMTTSGFPNLFFTYGPQAPTAFATGPSSAGTQGSWVVEALCYMRDNCYRSIDPTLESEQEWRKHVNELANKSLFPQAESWYFGANIPGRTKEALNYMGTLPLYREKIWNSANNGYSGFILSH